jgi:hypothetical protein
MLVGTHQKLAKISSFQIMASDTTLEKFTSTNILVLYSTWFMSVLEWSCRLYYQQNFIEVGYATKGSKDPASRDMHYIV